MSEALWESCGQVVARLESRLRDAIDQQIFALTATDMLDSLDPVAGIEISCRDGDGPRLICSIGDHRPALPVVQTRASMTQTSELAMLVWLNDEAATDDSIRQTILEVTEALCGLLVNGAVRVRLQETEHELGSVSDLCERLFDDGNPSVRFHRIAVELSSRLGVDRLSLLRRADGRYPMVASSVQAQFDSRALRVLETQAIAALLGTRPFAQADVVVHFRREDDPSIGSFLDRGGCNSIFVTQFVEGEILAIGERLDPDGDGQKTREQEAREQGVNTLAYRDLFEASLRDVLRSEPRRPLQWVREIVRSRSNRWKAAAAAGLVAGLLLFPMTIRVAADGRVIPRTQHLVYAPITGQLERVSLETGTRVDAGQVLCEFVSDELELELARLRGESITVQEQLQIAATRRSDGTVKEVASDRRVLETRLESLSQQISVLEDRQRELVIRSPIAGMLSILLPDDSATMTMPRPVQRGQAVLRVIEPADGYSVELDVPESDIGYVISAMEHQESDPVVCRFRIRSEPGQERFGTVSRLDQAATLDRFGGLVVTASIQSSHVDGDFAADSGVIGWIDCNRAASGYVMFRKVIERLRLWGWL